MTFECSTCRARYKIDEAIIPPTGARIRCRRCGAVLVIPPPVIEVKPVDLELIPSAPDPMAPEPRRAAPAPPPRVQMPSAPPRPVPAEPAGDSFIERFAPSRPSEIAQDPMVERWGTPGETVRQGAPPVPAASVETSSSQGFVEIPMPRPDAAGARVEPENVVPLSLGTPIPQGLSPDERERHEKARRLARVLASDIAIYNREKRDRGLVEGNLVAVLGYEIKKSWETYKERVGADFANATPYFRDALNELLAEGRKLF